MATKWVQKIQESGSKRYVTLLYSFIVYFSNDFELDHQNELVAILFCWRETGNTEVNWTQFCRASQLNFGLVFLTCIPEP